MNLMAAMVIEDYINDALFEPCVTWPKYYFDERTYSRWAANEILEEVKNSTESPITIIERFINKMDEFQEFDYGSDASNIFKYAKEAARGILCLFM